MRNFLKLNYGEVIDQFFKLIAILNDHLSYSMLVYALTGEVQHFKRKIHDSLNEKKNPSKGRKHFEVLSLKFL